MEQKTLSQSAKTTATVLTENVDDIVMLMSFAKVSSAIFW